jgi:hypothetical protein
MISMKKLLIITTAFIILSQASNGQLWKLRRYEISGGIGTTQFYSDIGGYPTEKNVLGLRDFTFKQTRFNLNGCVRYRFTEDFAAKVSLVFGTLHATDASGEYISRGFEANTIFVEPSLIAEYYFIKNKEENSFVFLAKNETFIKSVFSSLDFYCFTGIGGLGYKVSPNSVLAPHVTKTSGITEVVPLGVGVSLIYSGDFNFGVELGGRFTFSDYLDGYTSAQSKANDIYHLLNFTITYKINKWVKGLPALGR